MNITNRMKAECIGEFSWEEEADYYDEYGEIHEHIRKNIVPWDLCKDIYKAMRKIADEDNLKKMKAMNKTNEHDLMKKTKLN